VVKAGGREQSEQESRRNFSVARNAAAPGGVRWRSRCLVEPVLVTATILVPAICNQYNLNLQFVFLVNHSEFVRGAYCFACWDVYSKYDRSSPLKTV
jgi:hypothetical protein